MPDGLRKQIDHQHAGNDQPQADQGRRIEALREPEPAHGGNEHDAGKVGHLQSMCKSSKGEGNTSRGSSSPEAGQFDTYDGFAFTATIGAAEAFIGESGNASKLVDIWLGDSSASHHIKSSSIGMINVSKCPPGTTIRQVQGTVAVEQWGSVLLQVDKETARRQ